MKKSLGYGLLFLVTFALAVVLLLPWDLLATRFLFPRIQSRTGVSLSATDVRLSLPFSLEATGVRTSFRMNDRLISERIDRLHLTPHWRTFLGKRYGSVEIDLAGGTVAADVRGTELDITAKNVDLAALGTLGAFARFGVRGTASAAGSWGGDAGSVAVTLESLNLEGVKIAGVIMPPIQIDRLEGRLARRGNDIVVEEVLSSGGNLSLGLEGGLTPAQPFAASQLKIQAIARPTPAFLSALGGGTRMIEMLKKPDGSIRIGFQGTLSSPETSFQ